MAEKKQLSNIQLREKLRVLAPEAIVELKNLLKERNPYVRIAAVKIILSKLVPDLRSEDPELKERLKFIEDNIRKAEKGADK